MNRVITISLNGNAFQLEEAGYEALRGYLDTATARLKDNPDRDEIVSDLEQAIADKCGRYLGPHKSVIASTEIERILNEMGPVDAPAADGGPSAQSAGAGHPGRGDGAPKRLYQIHEGAMLSGVCNGFAAYFNVDVTVVRILFVLLTLLSGGIGILAYLVMMFVIPYANTSEEHAAARGQAFSASELIERAKKQYEEFRSRHDWRKSQEQWRGQWREQRRQWRQRQREWRRRWRYDSDQGASSLWGSAPAPRPVSYATRVIAGFMIPVFAILSAAVLVTWLIVLISLASTGTVFGWHLPYSIPVWAALLFVVLIYGAISGPLRAASRASRQAATGQTYGWYGFGDALVRLGFIVMFLWLAYHFIPGVHGLIDGLPDLWRAVTHEATTTAMNWLQ
ncbi:MAG TPA: PspC domain-containing protein [Steroidobacteraceae bacterium]|nr:PspC domain-containing protein [Steroidobacteraceae bacterium]